MIPPRSVRHTAKPRHHLAQRRRIKSSSNMISVIAQERLLGAALGGVFSGVIVYEQRKCIHQTICQIENKPPVAQAEIKDSVHRGRQIARLWNKAVDQTLGPVIASMSSRGW